jgi:hypothetical protein
MGAQNPILPSVKLLALLVAAYGPAHNALADGEPLEVASRDAIDEVVVIKRRESDYSVITEEAQKILDVPGSLGDPIMAAFSLPGVLSAGEAGAPAVRGSSPADNRYMVDGAPAGYVFHSFSTSVFNENIIQDFQLYSAGFGPQYSNAIGGVFDIKLRDPKHQPITTKLDLNALHVGAFVEGEVTDQSAFYLSARGSVLQYLFDDKSKDNVEKEDGIRVQQVPQDSDYQFKYQYDLDDANSIILSANGATDLAEAEFLDLSSDVLEDPDMAGDAKIKNNFQNAFISWRSQPDESSQFNLQLGQYINKSDTYWGDKKYFFNIKTTDNYLTGRYEFALTKDHSLSLGAEVHSTDYDYQAQFINYVCTEADPDCLLRRGELVNTSDVLTVNEQSVYVNDHWSLTDRLALDVGGQVHHNDLTDETFYQPRAAVSWSFADNWTLASSAGTYDRLPDMDKLFPEVGNPDLKSPESNHYTVGVKQLLGNGWSWSATAYYKTMDNLPRAMEAGATPNYTNNVEGEAYGLDLFVNKELTDKWYGWFALSTSKSSRRDKLTGKQTDYYLDTPVVFNMVANYKYNENWTFGGRFTARTGRAYTPIVGVQKNPWFDNHVLPVYGDAFSENLPTYTRLDLRFKRDTTFWGYPGAWTLDILNALNTRNVTDRHLDYKRTKSTQNFALEDEVGLGIIPAAGISITF